MAISNKIFNNLSKTKQERITRIVSEEFGEKGYSGASINAIVKRLGIAKGSIFQYFGDKKGLFLFVYEHSLEAVKSYIRTVRDQSESDDMFTRLEKSLLAGVHFLKGHPVIYKLYLKVMFDSKIPFRDEILLSLRENSHKYLRSLLQEAKTRGELRNDIDLDKANFVLDAVMDRFLQARTIRHLDAGIGIYKADDETTEHWISEIIDIMRFGMGGL